MAPNTPDNFDNDSRPPAEPPQIPQIPPPIPVIPYAGGQARQHPFSLSPVNCILLGIALIYGSTGFTSVREITPYERRSFVECLTVFILVPVLISWIAWRLSGRKRRGGSLACSIAAVVIMLWQGPPISGTTPAGDPLEQAERNRKRFVREALNSDNPFEIRRSHKVYTDSVKSGLEKMSRTCRGADKRACEIMLEFVNEAAARGRRWGDSFEAVNSSDVLRCSPLTSDEEFDRQIGIVKLYVQETTACRNYYANGISNMEERLGELEKIDSDLVKEILEGMKENYAEKQALMDRLMLAHVEYGGNLIRVLSFLRNNRDNWLLGADQFMFDNESVKAKFDEVHEQCTRSEETINKLRMELMNRE